jgi:hypothetical protein
MEAASLVLGDKEILDIVENHRIIEKIDYPMIIYKSSADLK